MSTQTARPIPGDVKDAATVRVTDLDWYALQTTSRAEKRVHERLLERSIECYVPLYESLSQWKDRKVRVQLPLFPGYVFVRFDLSQKLAIMQIAGAVRFVGFGGTLAALPAQEIEILRAGLGDVRARPHPYLRVGRRARVKSGPLRGMIGIVLKKKNTNRFVLSLDLIMRSMSVELDGLELEPILGELPERAAAAVAGR